MFDEQQKITNNPQRKPDCMCPAMAMEPCATGTHPVKKYIPETDACDCGFYDCIQDDVQTVTKTTTMSQLLITRGIPASIPYLGNGTAAVQSALARIASGDITWQGSIDPTGLKIVAVDNLDLQFEGAPLQSVVVYGETVGDALNVLTDAKQSALARLAAGGRCTVSRG